MQKIVIPLVIILAALWGCHFSSTETAEQDLKKSNIQLVWKEEFDKDGLPDPSKWSYDVGTACEKPAGCGWGNNEMQYYTDGRLENARVEDGKLIIEGDVYKNVFLKKEIDYKDDLFKTFGVNARMVDCPYNLRSKSNEKLVVS